MGHPESNQVEGNVQLGSGPRKTLREKRKDQWADIRQIVGDPQIFEFLGRIAREEINDAIIYIGRRNSRREPEIETKINGDASFEYIGTNSAK